MEGTQEERTEGHLVGSLLQSGVHGGHKPLLPGPSQAMDGPTKLVTTINTNPASCPQTYVATGTVSGRSPSIGRPVSCPAPQPCPSQQSPLDLPPARALMPAWHLSVRVSGCPPSWTRTGLSAWPCLSKAGPLQALKDFYVPRPHWLNRVPPNSCPPRTSERDLIRKEGL